MKFKIKNFKRAFIDLNKEKVHNNIIFYNENHLNSILFMLFNYWFFRSSNF